MIGQELLPLLHARTIGAIRSSDASETGPEFFRVVGAELLGGGILLLANHGTQSLIWIDESGLVRAETGRAGEGPGEYGDLTAVRSFDGGAVVWDRGRRRLTFYRENAELAGVARVDLRGPWEMLGSGPDRTVLLRSGGERAEADLRYVLVSEQGEVVREWHGRSLPSAWIRYTGIHPGTGRPVEKETHLHECLPRVFETTQAGRLLTVDGGRGTITSSAPWADESEVLLFQASRFTAGSADSRAYIRRALSGAPADVVAAAVARSEGAGGHLPLWSRAVLGEDGTFFLERAVCGPDTGVRLWDVVGLYGGHEGTFELPLAEVVLEGLRDRVFVMTLDSLDRESLKVYQIGGLR